MPNMNLNANSDWKQIGEAGAVLRLMINKKNPHISSFLEDPKSYQHEKCAPFTREIIHHCSYWISHIKTPIWKSYRLITQSDWKLRNHLLPINVYHGLVHLDGYFLVGKKDRKKSESVDLLEGAFLLLHLCQVTPVHLKHQAPTCMCKPTGTFIRPCIIWCI